MQPAVLEAPEDESSDDGSDDSGEDSGNPAGSDGGGDGGDDEDDPEKYTLQFHFTDDDGIPYSETQYIAFFEDGTQTRGETDREGYTEIFYTDTAQEIKVQLLFSDAFYIESEGHYGRE